MKINIRRLCNIPDFSWYFVRNILIFTFVITDVSFLLIFILTWYFKSAHSHSIINRQAILPQTYICGLIFIDPVCYIRPFTS